MTESSFVFSSYSFDKETGIVKLCYELGEYRFEEVVEIPVRGVDFEKVDEKELERALFNLHLIGGMSYWKASCPENIVLKSGFLAEAQVKFWNKVYTRGLGEFFYTNQIDFRGLVNFPFEEGVEELSLEADDFESGDLRPLVPIGGGKDSIVTAELLKGAGFEIDLFAAKDAAPIKATSEAIGGKRVVVARKIAPQLLELNKDPDTYNGHVPITAYLSFLSVVVALLRGNTDVVFALEKSANEGNVEYLGMDVNHQFSKSLEFERDLKNYLERFVTRRVRVFSLLRGLSEFYIVKIFSEYSKYFDVFSSCNRNFTFKNTENAAETFWCGECPKCAFMFVMLSAFLKHEEVLEIFGQDLFENSELLDLFKELLGIQGSKPFECVGEAKEVAAAFELAYRRGDSLETAMMKMYVNEARADFENADVVIEELLRRSEDDCVPEQYKSILKNL